MSVPSPEIGAASGGSSQASGYTACRPDRSGRWTVAGQAGMLVRPKAPRMIGGVCAAFALHFGWNIDAVRIVTAIFGLFYGVGILAYIACWIILPEAPHALPSRSQ